VGRRNLKKLESTGRRFLKSALLARIGGDVVSRIPPGEDLSRILLMRWDAIGDMVVSLPFFRKLAELHPRAEIRIVVSRRNLPLLKYEEGFQTILWDRRPEVFIRSLFRARAFQPDAVVDTRMHYDSTTSFLYALVSGAEWSVSAANRSNRLPFNVRVPIREAGHYSEMTATLLSAFGPALDTGVLDRELRMSSEERGYASAFWREVGIHLIGRAVAVNISAGNPARAWGARNNADLCRLLVSLGRPPVLMSSPGDREEALGIASSVEGALIAPLSPTILHAAALLEGMAALVTPDTAMVHIAAAHGVPVVGLYPVREGHMPTWQPWRVRHELLRTPEPGSVSAISPSDVLAAAARLLEIGETEK